MPIKPLGQLTGERYGPLASCHVEFYHNYQIYLDFARISHKIVLSLFWQSLDVSKSTDRMTNNVDPDQISLIWVYTVCSDLFVRIFSINILSK